MGHGDDMGRGEQPVIGEVRDVYRHLAGIQCRQYGLIIHDLAPGQIDDPHAPLHGGNGIGVDHVGRFSRVVDVQSNVIRPLIKVIDILDHMNVAVQPQGGVHGQEGIIAVNIHAEGNSGVGHNGADGTEADDAQRLFVKLRSHKGGLALFHHSSHLHAGGRLLPDPADSAGNIPGAHQHGADHQLFYGVGVGTGGGEHRDARRRAAVQRDVVHAHARPGDSQQAGIELHVQQLGGAN